MLELWQKKNIPSRILLRLFYSSPAVGDWIMKPELSTAHLGIQDRDLAYEEKSTIATAYCLFSFV
jgi:hypothetical protein